VPLETIGVLRPNGGRGVDRETAISKGIQQLDALVVQESFPLQQVENLESKQLLGSVGINVGNGNPLSLSAPEASGGTAVHVGMGLQERAEGLRDTNDAGSSVFVAGGFAKELLDGLVGETCEIGKQAAVSHEEGPQHFWQREGPQTMPDVFEQLVFEKGGEGGGALGIA
jgi:hypothetical protein